MEPAGNTQIPADLVEVGHVGGAYGIRGWVRIRPYSAGAEALLAVKEWWLDSPRLHDVKVMQARRQGLDIVACLAGVAERHAAEALRGAVVRISRRHFPALDEGEYYWVDLIGLAVFNRQGICLGTVKGLMDNGVHPVLQIETGMPEGKKRELLIPFVERHVGKIDTENRKMTVDWELDY